MSAQPEVAQVFGALVGQEPWFKLAETIDGVAHGIQSKGIEPEAVQALVKLEKLGPLTDTYLLGNHGGKFDPNAAARQGFLNMVVGAACTQPANPEAAHQFYDGSPEANADFTKSITRVALTHKDRHYGVITQRQHRRNGASPTLWLPELSVAGLRINGEMVSDAPIAIIGAGASGVISAAVASQLGFKDITIFDKHGRANGIWKQRNVHDGTRNNPADLIINKIISRAADPLNIYRSGREINHFLTKVAETYHNPSAVSLQKARVTSVEPGDLHHALTISVAGQTRTAIYPLVVNCTGTGKPLTPNDPARMSTPLENGAVGERWQRQFTPKDYQTLGDRVIIVGLGNSGAEIGYQIQKYAPNIDYRFLTHRSQATIDKSSQPVDGPALYRDTGLPELTSLAGDLRHIDAMKSRANKEGKIITDVRSWSHDGEGNLTVIRKDGSQQVIPYSHLFTLIGYGQDPAVNAQMGLATRDQRTGSIYHDFDGEVQRTGDIDPERSPRERIYPGYFALGPSLKNPGNPNAEVIPGIQYQVQFLAFTLVCRAVEAALRRSRDVRT